MKKFFMNPFAKVGVKGHNICRMMAVALLAFTMGACSDDDEIAPVEFPEQQELTCNVGETATLSFNASADWQLTSSALWCKFLANDKEEFAVSGKAGKQDITIKAGSESHGHEMSVALITLNMGGKKEVVAKVSRSAQNYELKVYDLEGNELDSIQVGYGKFSKFKVKANFRFAATNRPSWVLLDGDAMVGSANVATEGGLRAVENGTIEKYPVAVKDGQCIEFADEEGKASFSFPLTFAGMDSTEIDITGVTNNVWDWTVSLDGKEFLQESSSGLTGEASKTLYKNRLPFTIKALNDDYEVIFMDKYEGWGSVYLRSSTDGDVNWMSFDKATQTLSVSASDVEEREGYVLAFPRKVYNELTKDNIWESDLIDYDPETGEQIIAFKYQQNNLLVNFIQKEKKQEVAPSDEPNIKVYYNDMMTGKDVDIDVTLSADEGLKQEYSVDEVYVVNKNSSPNGVFFINPMLDESEVEIEARAFVQHGSESTPGFIEGMGGIFMVDLENLPNGKSLDVTFYQNGICKRVVVFE